MLALIDDKKALSTYMRYFAQVSKTGYIEHCTMMKFLAYQFFIDLIDYTHAFFEEEDYDIVDQALRSLFTNGGCLLPFPVFCANRAVLGRNEYMGDMKIRKTEDLSGYEDRYTEDGDHRTV